MKISVAALGVTFCIIAIVTGENVQTDVPNSNVSYAPVTASHVTAHQVTHSPHGNSKLRSCLLHLNFVAFGLLLQ